ncbi:hypothetical protein [Mesorhizobium retamae]|uniref:PD(D/E)XK endonuclease domain-containing protein n=1 Tax=Mesorhizobium retamae TaxID=2912854 RepID=A0ABS9QPI6_9HYPH|nr:hypothetical protein [Mesorhizobium sp. IRAMC:0171]MCG7509366.1 hypothetical protein [Mesorhizobium sp. IRAMC:0171]
MDKPSFVQVGSDAIETRSRLQITGNAGLYYVSWHLSRRGWHVMPTVRNARGSDLIVTNSDETVYLGVQSKALSKRAPVPLGRNLDSLCSDWWIITINANNEQPTCFVMTREEVKGLAYTDRVIKSDKGPAHWLQPKAYDRPEYRNAWHRLDNGC